MSDPEMKRWRPSQSNVRKEDTSVLGLQVLSKSEVALLNEFLSQGEKPYAPPWWEAPRTRGVPELHPADFEWYFTREIAEELASNLTLNGRHHALLGVPTVAVTAARRGLRPVLIDRNLLVRRRFSEINDRRVHFLPADLNRPLRVSPGRRFDTVFFDGPWYWENTMYWLWQSVNLLRRKGVIQFSLFPARTRPTAPLERETILAYAERIGKTSVYTDALVYETPVFEVEALTSSPSAPLRHGDLVRIEVNGRPRPPPPPTPAVEPAWTTFVFGTQVVKVRRRCFGPTGALLSPIPGCDGFRLQSVSRRDPLRTHVDVWTSRNRVARVGAERRGDLLKALRRFSRLRSQSDAIAS
jgi:hypothetical protein